MSSFEIILDNFKFLVLEVNDQVKLTQQLLNGGSDELLDKIDSKDDYIDNLKTIIEDKCFSRIHGTSLHLDQNESTTIRSIHIMSVNLERIADFCVNIVRQTRYFHDPSFLHHYAFDQMIQKIKEAIAQIISVFQNHNLGEALEICRAEMLLDEMYKANFDQIMDDIQTVDAQEIYTAVLHSLSAELTSEKPLQTKDLLLPFDKDSMQNELLWELSNSVVSNLRNNHSIQDHITAIFIFRYLERIGDSILNIGEALIFAIIGDRIKIRQFAALEKTLSESGFEGDITDIDFQSILGSRSGCHIGRVEPSSRSSFKTQGIFKEGMITKIKQEKENIDRWHGLLPGIAPRIFGYYEKHGTGSMLLEFCPGCTLDEVILSSSDEILSNALFVLSSMLQDIWECSLNETPSKTDFMQQLNDRLAKIQSVHPEYLQREIAIGNTKVLATRKLIKKCSAIEKKLSCPFSVLLHGDFNTNNLIYNYKSQKINFIDLYRSRYGDYVQDASVFLVSNFRLPFFGLKERNRLNDVIAKFYKLFEQFAIKQNDRTFQLRMALALARSFFTSIRFEMDDNFAKNMYMRALFLIEKIVLHHDGPPESFRLPKAVLFY